MRLPNTDSDTNEIIWNDLTFSVLFNRSNLSEFRIYRIRNL